MILTLQTQYSDDIDYTMFVESISSLYCVYRVNIITGIDSTHSIMMIIDSTQTV